MLLPTNSACSNRYCKYDKSHLLRVPQLSNRSECSNLSPRPRVAVFNAWKTLCEKRESHISRFRGIRQKCRQKSYLISSHRAVRLEISCRVVFVLFAQAKRQLPRVSVLACTFSGGDSNQVLRLVSGKIRIASPVHLRDTEENTTLLAPYPPPFPRVIGRRGQRFTPTGVKSPSRKIIKWESKEERGWQKLRESPPPQILQ